MNEKILYFLLFFFAAMLFATLQNLNNNIVIEIALLAGQGTTAIIAALFAFSLIKEKAERF